MATIFPVTGGPSPDYSGIFIPTLWSGKFVEKFYDATVLAAISNTDYEGEITNYGDKVVIRTKPTIQIRDYSAYGTLTTEKPSSDAVNLLIDKGKYWAAVMDDVMEVQSDVDQLSAWADDASQQMKIVIDRAVLNEWRVNANIVDTNRGADAGLYSGAGAATGINLGVTTSPVAIDKTNVVDKIVEAGVVLDEQNVPEQGRFMVVPPWFTGMVKRSEIRDASLTGDGVSVLRNGRIGMIDRFTLYNSNLLPSGLQAAVGNYTATAAGEWMIPFGHSKALTFATQLVKMETLRAESTFGTLLRGLQVYGHSFIDNKLVGRMVVSKA